MSEPLLPPALTPSGVNDERNRAFLAAFSELLSTFKPSALLVQDAWTAPAALLPIMVVEAGMTDFVSADMREAHVRALIDAAPEIHAMSGTIAGTRRALTALGITARWTQWWQQTPRAHHNTHRVVLFFSDPLIDGSMPLDIPNQQAAARVIAATKRWSQDIFVQYGMRGTASVYAGAALRRSRRVRIDAPRPVGEQFTSSIFMACVGRSLRRVRINAKAA